MNLVIPEVFRDADTEVQYAFGRNSSQILGYIDKDLPYNLEGKSIKGGGETEI